MLRHAGPIVDHVGQSDHQEYRGNPEQPGLQTLHGLGPQFARRWRNEVLRPFQWRRYPMWRLRCHSA